MPFFGFLPLRRWSSLGPPLVPSLSRPLRTGPGPGGLALGIVRAAAFSGLLLAAGPALGQNLQPVLEVALQVETSLLEAELDRYAAARVEERQAFRDWETLIRELDRALQDQAVSIQELRDLEKRATLAREGALARSRQVTDLRGRLLDRMERISVVEERLAREERTRLVPVSTIDGLWRVAVEPLGVSGLVRLRADGTLVSGTYRMESGSVGSVTGTFAEGRLELDRIDVQQGFDATLEGELDAAAGVVRGFWRAVDVTGGSISGGSWSARKLSPEERRRVEAELDGRR